jgi:WD40 repeat protein
MRYDRAIYGVVMDAESVAWSPDSAVLASAFENDIQLWNAATGDAVATLRGLTGAIYSVAWSPDGMLLASASYDETIRLWNAATGKALAMLTGHTDEVVNVAWSPDGTRLASAGSEGVRVWGVRDA